MNEKIILTDADGCLFHWNAHFNLFMHEKGLPPIPNTEDNYSVLTRFGVEPGHKAELVREFNHSDYIRDLHPFADARKYVRRLNDDGYKFIVVTSLSDDPDAYDNRAHNLEKHFGDAILELHCLPIGIHKGDFLERWKDSGFYWIEDHVENAAAGADLGLRSIVIDHPYNTAFVQHDRKLHARVSYATPWYEIYTIIKAEE